MASQYYYEVTALPMLVFGESPKLTLAAFASFVHARLPSSAAMALDLVSLLPDHDPCCEVERDWQTWETYMRNSLVRLRAQSGSAETAKWLRPDRDVFPGDRRRLEEIFSQGHPLSRQRELDTLRWERLDDLSVGHAFDLGALVIYKLKLLIACRLDAVSAEEGRTRHDAAVTNGLQRAEDARVSTGVTTVT